MENRRFDNIIKLAIRATKDMTIESTGDGKIILRTVRRTMNQSSKKSEYNSVKRRERKWKEYRWR